MALRRLGSIHAASSQAARWPKFRRGLPFSRFSVLTDYEFGSQEIWDLGPGMLLLRVLGHLADLLWPYIFLV